MSRLIRMGRLGQVYVGWATDNERAKKVVNVVGSKKFPTTYRAQRDSNPFVSWPECNEIKVLPTEQESKNRPTRAPRGIRGLSRMK